MTTATTPARTDAKPPTMRPAAVVARAQLEAASRALVTALRAEAASTDDAELRSLLDASRAAVERETRALGKASRAAIGTRTRALEWRLAVLLGRVETAREPRASCRDLDLTDFLVDVHASER